MADSTDPNDEDYVKVEIDNNDGAQDVTTDQINKEIDNQMEKKEETDNIKKKKINWEEEDIVLAEKDNKTSNPEYYLRSDVKLANKIVEDAIEDSTHPYDHPNFFIRWFYKITYVFYF